MIILSKEEYAPYFEPYIQLLSDKKMSLVEYLIASQNEFDFLLRNLPKEKQAFRYAKGKWTIKELIQHIIDTERVFCYRALCFARNDKTSLPGFDQDLFVDNGNANQIDFIDLLDEMAVLRKGTIHLFKNFSTEAMLRKGIASENYISVRALGFLFSGHQLHHIQILKERYL